ncbi:MAG: hypothetical protein FVQ83_16235 [Chloroflexi bacterium]|nr:hypothetical protein [Chloroflexota bacterium]
MKSGDTVDVVFDLEDEIIAVEIKSKRSGTDDLERGIYQCVKYLSVLEAERIVNKKDVKIHTILVLEDHLPLKLNKIKNALNIQVIQKVSPIKT